MTYLDLADIDYQPQVAVTLLPQSSWVTVMINQQKVWYGAVDQMATVVHDFKINSPLTITVLIESGVINQPLVAQITVDGQDHTDWIGSQSQGSSWNFDSGCAYYEWLHQVTGQGWLLKPILRPQDTEDTDQRGAV